MSKNAKDLNDDFYSGEEINYEDYYLDDEDEYLDEDEDIHGNMRESIREHRGGPDKAPIDPNPVKKTSEKHPEDSDIGKAAEQYPSGPEGKREGADIPYQASGTNTQNLEVRDQKDMKKEINKNPDKKREEPVKRDTGKIKNGPEKSGTQKSGAVKQEAPKAGAGKKEAPKTSTGKKEAPKDLAGKKEVPKANAVKKEAPKGAAEKPGPKSGPERTGASKSTPGKAGAKKTDPGKPGVQKNGGKRPGTRKSSGNPAKATGSGRRQKKSGLPVALITVGVFIGVCAAAYIGVSVYFMSHFYMNTEINGHDFSRQTVEDVKEYIQQQVKGYSLTIREKDNKTDTISGAEISLEYKENQDIENVLKNQNAFLWPQAFFVKNSSKATVEVSYDRDALEKKIHNLQAVKAEQTPPTSAYPKFNGTEYEVEPEVTGTEVNQDLLREKIHQYISEFQPELDMVAENCYALPKYTSESGDVRAACNEMNEYLKASITYSMDQPVVVDKTLISNWVSADENMKVTFDEAAVREWLREFGKQYDTVGKTRTITSPWGKTVEVSGGTYGWSVDEDAEFPALVESIKKGEVVTREPIYVPGQTAASRGPQDWGNTYAEVDLSGQHMWFIVDGAIALETDVVTGVPNPARETPSGVYSILEKELNSTLVGEVDPTTGEPEYRTPVAYWMRVTWSGIGFHDANWQPAFGGSLYATGAGSHGCINMPVDQAGALFNMMPVGTPVIIHY